MEFVDVAQLRRNVMEVYKRVAQNPDDGFHFGTGRRLAATLGYPAEALEEMPEEAVMSFAGVGCPFELAGLEEGGRVLDLGSGSGMDAFFAAAQVGRRGRVTGLDMTREQLDKANRLRQEHGYENVSFVNGHVEEIPLRDQCVDVVISNGVINLSADKARVFREISRVLAAKGRLVVCDIVSELQLSDAVVCDASLWAACIGGAAQLDSYVSMIRDAGLEVQAMTENVSYEFLSESARAASREFGVKSVTLLARPEG